MFEVGALNVVYDFEAKRPKISGKVSSDVVIENKFEP